MTTQNTTDFDRYLDAFRRGVKPAFPVDQKGKDAWYAARDAAREPAIPDRFHHIATDR